jgi:trans-AT polyketide synthase, acyltransferase and oxidoreductase domains
MVRLEKKEKDDMSKFSIFSLGDKEFKRKYNLKYPYLAGSMVRGISSKEMVVKLAKAGMLGFLGTGGMNYSEIEDAIRFVKKNLTDNQSYGMNLLHTPNNLDNEEKIVNLYLANEVKIVEASAFLLITPALVKYHLKGLKKDNSGNIITSNRILAKISRPEVAKAFLSPAPDEIVHKLLAEKKITQEEAELSKKIPVADDICVESDSGGHTDGQNAFVLLPAMIKLRDEIVISFNYQKRICIGSAGGIGTPEAAAAAFILGADFIMTGSINQCTVEAGTSESAKDLLQQMNIQDTEYTPAGDMFELGAKVQVLKKGLLFPARANKLFDIYRHYNSLDEVDDQMKRQIQDKYFNKDFNSIYNECKKYYNSLGTNEIERSEKNPKVKMALIFKWYFNYSNLLAINGNEENQVNYQIHCGPSLGAFNQWVKGTELENWRNRYVDQIAIKLLNETEEILQERYNRLFNI